MPYRQRRIGRRKSGNDSLQAARKEEEVVSLLEKIDAGLEEIRKSYKGAPDIAIILGTGLGRLAADIAREAVIEYEKIPYFGRPTLAAHAGNLVCGRLSGKAVVAMEGRFHYYEGYSPEQITLPVRVMRVLGAKTLIVSNAGGGMNPQYETGDIMIIEDHINLMGFNPLIGEHDDRLGSRFPDMSEPYDRGLIQLAYKIALEKGIAAHKGVYVGVPGPNLETRAEYRFLRATGADVVGMNTVPEVIVAVQMGMKVLGLSVVTDLCLPDALKPANIEEIIRVATEAEPKLEKIVSEVVARL